jgi:hypothetical protein
MVGAVFALKTADRDGKGIGSEHGVPSIEQCAAWAFLKDLQSPPETLSPDEHAALAPLSEALNAHYDQMSMDEIMARIERLGTERRQELLAWLVLQLAPC